MPNCQTARGNTFYAERGQGEALIFLGGLGGDHLYWLGQLRAFGKHYRCLAPDNRDVGQSSYVAVCYTPHDLADDIAGMMRQLQIGSAHLVGLSMGGMIAQELALALPELVASLMLVNTLGRADDWFQGTLRAFELIRLQVPTTAAFFDAVLPWWVSPQFFAESGRTTWLRWLLQQNPHPQSLEGFLRQLEAIRRHDVLDRLHGIKCPVLILAGEDDSIAPLRYSRELREHISHAQLVQVPGVGHAFPIENPGQFNEQLRLFLTHVHPSRRRSA
jgi:pimeloyl-ACP methyl ester carboxylesterase